MIRKTYSLTWKQKDSCNFDYFFLFASHFLRIQIRPRQMHSILLLIFVNCQKNLYSFKWFSNVIVKLGKQIYSPHLCLIFESLPFFLTDFEFSCNEFRNLGLHRYQSNSWIYQWIRMKWRINNIKKNSNQWYGSKEDSIHTLISSEFGRSGLHCKYLQSTYCQKTVIWYELLSQTVH